MSYRWKPLQRADYGEGHRAEVIEATMLHYSIGKEEAIAKLNNYDDSCELWRNDLYQVQTRRFVVPEFGGTEMMHLNIRRIDGAAIFDWRHRQLIKNQLVGTECEAVEMYPAESRLVDTSNKYHLFAFTDPNIRWPFGIDSGKRDVIDNEVKSPPGMRQRRVLK